MVSLVILYALGFEMDHGAQSLHNALLENGEMLHPGVSTGKKFKCLIVIDSQT
jgi:hypothetical protein